MLPLSVLPNFLPSALVIKGQVIDYLEGAGVYKICSDPRDVTSLHAFNFSIECYNKLAAKYPQFELDRRFSEEIISKLKSDECNVYDVYYLLTALLPN